MALIFIANPNNPTGQKIQWWDIDTLLNHIPETTLLIIDEAYFEYDDAPHKLQSDNPYSMVCINIKLIDKLRQKCYIKIAGDFAK